MNEINEAASHTVTRAALCPAVDDVERVPTGAVAPRLRAPLRTYGTEEGRDEQLVARVCAGDVEAFEQIVERYQDPLVGYLSRLTNSRDRAEEYAQETFLRLYQSAHRYRERGHLSAYLYRIATNLLRSEERRKRRFRIVESLLLHSEPPPQPSAQREAIRREEAAVLSAAVAELPVEFRAPLVLREIEAWSYAEIALALGCRVGTVKSRINRAKARLRERLAPYWNGGERDEV